MGCHLISQGVSKWYPTGIKMISHTISKLCPMGYNSDTPWGIKIVSHAFQNGTRWDIKCHPKGYHFHISSGIQKVPMCLKMVPHEVSKRYNTGHHDRYPMRYQNGAPWISKWYPMGYQNGIPKVPHCDTPWDIIMYPRGIKMASQGY